MKNDMETETNKGKKMKRSVFYVGSEVWSSPLGAKAKLIYTYLCRCSNAAGESFPSVRNIAENCGISKRTVQRAIRELESFGALTVEERYIRSCGARRRTSNIYRIPVSLRNNAGSAGENDTADESGETHPEGKRPL